MGKIWNENLHGVGGIGKDLKKSKNFNFWVGWIADPNMIISCRIVDFGTVAVICGSFFRRKPKLKLN